MLYNYYELFKQNAPAYFRVLGENTAVMVNSNNGVAGAELKVAQEEAFKAAQELIRMRQNFDEVELDADLYTSMVSQVFLLFRMERLFADYTAQDKVRFEEVDEIANTFLKAFPKWLKIYGRKGNVKRGTLELSINCEVTLANAESPYYSPLRTAYNYADLGIKNNPKLHDKVVGSYLEFFKWLDQNSEFDVSDITFYITKTQDWTLVSLAESFFYGESKLVAYEGKKVTKLDSTVAKEFFHVLDDTLGMVEGVSALSKRAETSFSKLTGIKDNRVIPNLPF